MTSWLSGRGGATHRVSTPLLWGSVCFAAAERTPPCRGWRVGRTCLGILVILRRFLRPWWVVSNVLVLALLVVMVNLGAWQLRRL